jgi:hypothetical protein
MNANQTVSENIKPGQRYRHYKGKEYKIVGIAHHSETLQPMVVYQALYDAPGFGKDSLWVRPRDMFLEMVEVNGVKQPRFSLIA